MFILTLFTLFEQGVRGGEVRGGEGRGVRGGVRGGGGLRGVKRGEEEER